MENNSVQNPVQTPPSALNTQQVPQLYKKKASFKFIAAATILLLVGVVGVVGGYLIIQKSKSANEAATITSQDKETNPSIPTSSEKSDTIPTKVGVSYDVVEKSVTNKVLGDSNTDKKKIPVQIFAFEDNNGNGVREPDDKAISLMPVNIYDSPFSDTPIHSINSTDSGWASVLLDVSFPYQLVVVAMPTNKYVPTTKPIILSETNNFAVVGYKMAQLQSFHTSIFTFIDSNKDSNYNYDDPNEKPLFLAPFKFYQEKADGEWEQLPNTANSTDTGWCTTSNDVAYPYRVKVVAEDVNNLTPANKEIIITNKDSTLVFPFISK